MARKKAFDPFQYLDYRALLRDYYDFKKAEGRGFSYRVFARQAKMQSPNHLKRVIDGERNLTSEMAIRYASACGFEGDAMAYFCDLVAFNNAETIDERQVCYERLTGFQKYRKAQRIDLAHAAYHAKWFLPAIRELVMRPDFSEDSAWIGSQLVPPVHPKEAAQAIETLLELGLLVRENGMLKQGEAIVSTGPETFGLHIANYHRAMMERAMGAIDLVPPAERDISSVTMCLPQEELPRFKQKIQAFRRELVAAASQFSEGDVVVQFNLQLFPLSVRNKKKEV